MPSFTKKIRTFKIYRWACRGVIAAATGLSMWANVLDSKGPVSIVANGVAPLLVLAGFELVSRVPNRKDKHWLLRLIRPLSTVAISGIGAWLSYWHQYEAFLRAVPRGDTARLLPLAIDGLVVIASVSLLDLNVHIEELEARAQGLSVRISAPPKAVAKGAKVPDTLTTKERIALVLQQAPDLTYREIAKQAGTTYETARTWTKRLREEAQPPSLAPAVD